MLEIHLYSVGELFAKHPAAKITKGVVGKSGNAIPIAPNMRAIMPIVINIIFLKSMNLLYFGAFDLSMTQIKRVRLNNKLKALVGFKLKALVGSKLNPSWNKGPFLS